jgi:sugar-specific transcriptional regulator TrmB
LGEAAMSDDIVAKLVSFGFTINQAKVYLTIVQSGKTRVGRISKTTQLHRQDIYKLIPKLEKMGLITKTIDKPFMIEAVPIEKALENVIVKEREKANLRINSLEKNLKDMVNAIQQQPELKEEARFTLLTTDEAIKNKSKYAFKKPRKQFLVVTTVEHIVKPGLHHFRDFLQNIADTNAKLRLLIVGSEGKDVVLQTLEKTLPPTAQMQAKHIPKTVCKNFQIIDNKEAWLSTQQKTELGYPCILWTNDQNIVDAYRDHFKKTWSSPRAKTIYRSDSKEFITQLNDETLMPLPS